MSGESVQWPAPQPAPEISANYCKELFNHMLGEQEKFLDSAAAENRAPLRMLVIKVGECESFNYYSNRPSKYKYMWICRRINDGLLRTWFVRDTSFGFRDEQYEDVLLSHGFAVPWGILPGVSLRASVREDLGSSLLLLTALENVAHPPFNVVRACQFLVEGLDG
ncbi:uncharacterized protein ASPGLDRAFT_27608 [Aspergillus glaucus CBS 516.65]|uniref:Uncharacterized protein n=1 Tax=Aspergillus glaucus CBS 516.65 TaxID=1160497 RepID=A0A1L9VEB1_ASPGL|nr:hypothetical protein ASPGLDRAFT_27608 [Aspergillus glaucus CBS 516.65]OJJ82225.1 hypothetical protein ASPGLDRAFT_27608 [Aspergillus glaucus CBS 516.65]